MIDINKLSVIFNQGTPLENPALRQLSLRILSGQFVTLIGSNGSGKSTLLNVLAGEVAPRSGYIRIHNQEVTRQSTAQRAKLVARVFQDPVVGTCADLSLEENLALAAGRGLPRGLRRALPRTCREEFRAALARLGLGLEKRLADPMSLLSGGQRQAVSLLMATLRPAQILLLDEHTAALDPKTAEFVLELTENIISEQKLTTLMVTHSMRQALAVGGRTVMMHQGRIIFDTQGKDRKKLDIANLLALFEKARGEDLDEDAVLLD
jgi:putative ABC transport system ATP-binding protein